MELAVLLRTCKHSEIDITSRDGDGLPDKFGYALKCDNISISYSKTPIQVPIPQQSPQLIDIGVYRPSISTSGIIDTVGGQTVSAVGTVTALNDSTDLGYWNGVSAIATSIVVDSASDISVGDVLRLDQVVSSPIKTGGGINATATALEVDTFVEFAVDDIVQIGTEDIKITAINSSTGAFTITRGVNGTTAAVHAVDAVVTGLPKSEDMDVTAISTNTLTVVRGINGTTARHIVDNTPLQSYGPAFFEGLSVMNYTRTNGYGATVNSKPYYLPYKNRLEDFTTDFVYSAETPLELEWGNANFAGGTQQTGGAIYLVALQQSRFQVDAAKEDRYTFSLQFVVSARKDK